jgi:hypothetical protein
MDIKRWKKGKGRLMRRAILIILVGVSILFLSGTQSKWKGSKKIINGVVHMHNPKKGLWQNKKEIVIEEVLSIGVEGDDEDYLLAFPLNVTTDNSHNIYISDLTDDCIKVYDKQGRFLRRIGREGQGPGEFMQLEFGMDITYDNKLIVSQEYQSFHNKISIFELNGEFIHSFNITDIGTHHIFGGDDGKLFCTRRIRTYDSEMMNYLNEEYQYEVYLYDLNGKLLDRFCDLEDLGQISGRDYYSEYAYISEFSNGNLCIAFQYPYLVKIHGQDGKHIMTVKRENVLFKPPKLVEETTMGRKVSRFDKSADVRNIITLPDDKFLVVIRDNSAEDEMKSTILDLYNSEGYYLQNFYWEEGRGHRLVHMDKDGFLYTVSGMRDIPKVKKYKISFVEK